MTRSYRILRPLITVIPAVGLFLLIIANPLAQSNKLPAPSSYVSDFAGVIDAETKSRLESLLQRFKEKSKIELYVATVDSTGAQEISAFSQQLANNWNIGGRNSRGKSLLLVLSAESKTSFTQTSRLARAQLPEGVLGEMSYRMQGPLSDGRFGAAVDSGVHVFVNALAEKLGFNAAELETSSVAVNSSEVVTDSPRSVLVGATDVPKTRPRVVSEVPKALAEPTPPADPPRTEPTPTDTPTTEPTPSESPANQPVVSESPKPEATPSESPKTETPNTGRKASATTRVTPVRKKTAAQLAEQEADESEEVELTLTLPLVQRAVKLKEFLDTHPNSKSRSRATELLISTHASLGDQKLKNGDMAGGTAQLLQAIDEADVSISDQLFFGVVSQIPTNLYLRGEQAAAFKAAQNVEAKFGTDPKRLLAVAGFYMGIERAAETIRIAESAVKLAPDLAEAHRVLAVGLHISLRLDEAIAEYKRTLELDPTSKVSRGSLADLYRASGKTEEALSLYNEQLAADPKDRAARAGKVISLFELGRTEEANSSLEASLADEPRNLPLLTGAAYWLTAHNNHEKAFELARKAVEVEARYTWAQIALARSLLGLKRPLDAERALRFARQYGKFPTLTYELANVLSSMGLYEEAVEVLRESFTIKDGQVNTYLAGHVPASEPGFLELLAPERRAGIYQSTSADSAANARAMKALLAFNVAITPATEGAKINETDAAAAAQEFASGNDSMRAFRAMYAASRLVRNGVGIATALDLIADARKASDEALKVPVLTMAVQADEFRELRARSIAAGNVPDVADAPREVLASILKGRLEDLQGWALFNQEKYPEAITHLKQAAEILPAETPAWRAALWHLGAALEQSGQKEQALDNYIKSYRGGSAESVRRSVIEQLYRSVHGSLDGLEERLGTGVAGARAGAGAVNSSTPPGTTTPTTITEPAPAESPKSETATPPAPAPEMSEESLKNAASRLRSNVKINGRIVDASKAGLGNVVVVLISPSGTVLATTTDNEGNYSFTVAPSQKTYRVIPSMNGYTFAPLDRTIPGVYEDQRQMDFTGSKP
jgi:tetratricopeptide (TPR) repeat protein